MTHSGRLAVTHGNQRREAGAKGTIAPGPARPARERHRLQPGSSRLVVEVRAGQRSRREVNRQLTEADRSVIGGHP